MDDVRKQEYFRGEREKGALEKGENAPLNGQGLTTQLKAFMHVHITKY